VLQPLRRLRSVGVWPLIVTAAVALSACGSSPTPGVLTQAEIPSYLGVTKNPSLAASEAKVVASIHRCKRAVLEFFTVPGKLSRIEVTPAIVSFLESCATVADTKSVLPIGRDDGPTVKGIGNEAELVASGISPERVRVESTGWRDDSQVGLILLEGSPTDKRITPALVELLARRAVAAS
jgi:hypothetical protein